MRMESELVVHPRLLPTPESFLCVFAPLREAFVSGVAHTFQPDITKYDGIQLPSG